MATKFIFNKENCFIISIDKENNTRLEKIKKRLEYFNIEFTHWKASTPDKIEDTFAGNFSPTEKACAQSHINIWKYIVENNLEYALILEDDACFRKDFLNIINNFWKDIDDPNWHSIFLNASEEEKINEKFILCKEQYLCAGYIMSQSGANFILNLYKNKYCSADWMTTRLQLYNHSYTYFPWLIIQDGKDSYIQSNEHLEKDKEKVLRILKDANYLIENYI
jgi:GR25 family glycosyltransferase involved in LPS biosynthesis